MLGLLARMCIHVFRFCSRSFPAVLELAQDGHLMPCMGGARVISDTAVFRMHARPAPAARRGDATLSRGVDVWMQNCSVPIQQCEHLPSTAVYTLFAQHLQL
jgi:hypothetical protein